jgi:hypothetical protein
VGVRGQGDLCISHAESSRSEAQSDRGAGTGSPLLREPSIPNCRRSPRAPTRPSQSLFIRSE